jgi:pimeloyl-ACP methyl ester carboxylesterase
MKTGSLLTAAILITASVAMLFGLVRCTPLAQYRTSYTPCISARLPQDCADRAIQEYQPMDAGEPGYLLGIVEFDDQGQLFSRAQLDAVLNRIEQEASTREFLAVVFVHGWKHNAKEGDDNLNRFRGTLERLSQIETALSHAQGVPPRRVIGIYLGWRGLSITTPLLQELTFWDRKNTAQKVGHGEVTEVLSRLELIRQVKNAQDPSTHSRTRLVVVGHSFGGAVVFAAVGQILESRFMATAGPTGVSSDAEGFGDLVVLINPAFEAVMYSPLSDLSTERASYFRSQLPVIAVLTSEKDSATGFWFPFGRLLSTWFEKERKVSRANPITHGTDVIDQRRANVASVGHFEPYRTHYLRATADNPARIAAAPTQERVRSYLGAAQNWEDDAPGSRIGFPGSILERTANSAGRNPYLVVQVDGKLIPNHNDIWDPRIESFIGHLMEVSTQSADFEERTQRRSRALQAR